MEESLKAARVIHQIVIVAATAMLIFAMSTRSPENEYSRALEELRVLDVAVSEIDQTIAKDIDSNYSELLEFLRIRYGSHIQLLVRGSLGEGYLGSPIHATRENIVRIVESLRRIPISQPSIEITERIDGWVTTNPPCGTMVLRVDIRIGANELACSGDQIAELEIGDHLARSSTEALLLEKQLVHFSGVEPAGIKGVDALPAMRAVWDEVAGLDPVFAGAALRRKAQESARSSSPKLSVLGLEMNASAAIIAGPAILVALLLYLYAHLLHIQTIAKGNEGLLRDFPWLPLFDSRLSLGLTISTLWLLPSVAAVWTVWVAGLGLVFRIALALGYAAGLGLTAFACIRKAGELNRLLSAPLLPALAAPPQPGPKES